MHFMSFNSMVGMTLTLSSVSVACTPSDRTGYLRGSPPRSVARIVGDLEPDRVKSYVDALAGFGTRHTLSDTKSATRGIGAARRWIKAEFDRFAADSGRSGRAAIRVYFDRYLQKADGRRIARDVEIVNVVMEIPGVMPEAQARRYYVIGHYDSIPSRNADADSDAPGANDDASGTAVVMELARVLSRHRFDSTIVLMATAAEEQGLFGAAHHAQIAKEKEWDIRAVLNNDIVGDPSSPAGGVDRKHIRLFSEGVAATASERDLSMLGRFGTYTDSPSRQIARFIVDVARWEHTEVQPLLIFRRDRFGRGGDHSAFNRQGFPAVRFCEVTETYTRQHQDVRTEEGVAYGDVPEFVDGAYLSEVARLNASVVIHLAQAPSSPINVRVHGRTARTTVTWDASREPDVAGYEVVWRPTTSPVWEFSRDAGSALKMSIDVSRDNHYFGVRAYDRDGFRSPVGFSSLIPRRRGR